MGCDVRVLLIGDPHVTVEELADCQRLLDYVEKVASEAKPTAIVFLGDQHHNHAVIRVEVLDLWYKWLGKMTFEHEQRVIMLVGNHDRSHDTAIAGNTLRYNNVAKIVSEPFDITENVRLVPWCAKPEDFVRMAGNATTVICHQTLQGAHYENGFPATDGVGAELLPAKHVISGHIHTPQKFGKVWYPGAPRWRTLSDANISRAIWSVDFDASGAMVAAKEFTTVGVCTALYTIDDREGDQESAPGGFAQPCRAIVNIFGSPGYVEARTKFWRTAQPGCRINPFPTRESKHVIRESDGVPVALKRHVETYQSRYGTSTAVLQKMVAERVRL